MLSVGNLPLPFGTELHSLLVSTGGNAAFMLLICILSMQIGCRWLLQVLLAQKCWEIQPEQVSGDQKELLPNIAGC